MRNVFIYNNTLYQGNNTSRVCLYYRSVAGTKVHNNLLISAGARLLDIGSDAGNCVIQANGYYSSGTFAIRDDGVNYSSLAAWRTASGQERRNNTDVGVQANPLLSSMGNAGTLGNARLLNTITAYRLQVGSPMANAGLSLQTVAGLNPGTRDFWGTAIPVGSAPDIGCNEFVPTSSSKHLSQPLGTAQSSATQGVVDLSGRVVKQVPPRYRGRVPVGLLKGTPVASP
jgi:hypothetical protein